MGEGKYETLPGLAAELVRLKMDVILTAAVPAIRRPRKRPVRSLSSWRSWLIRWRPVSSPASRGREANITGLSVRTPELVGKQFGLLKEIVPKASRVAVLWNPGNLGNPPQLRAAELAARTLGIRLQSLEARNPREIDSAFAAMTREAAAALVVLVDVMFIDHRTRIADLAATRRLPAVYGQLEHVESGGLMAYAPNFLDNYGRAAVFVDKILRGANPGDIPIEQSTKFELVINLKTAKALGLAIPRSVLLQADRVIE
jgi:putative ABC transport system substrate-binding protein